MTPIVECIDKNGDGSITAHFGYQNSNSQEVSVAIGAHNFFAPGSEDRGQPDMFMSGRVVNVFTVKFTGGSLTWTVLSKSATASADSGLCSPETPTPTPTPNLTPNVDCNGVPNGTAKVDQCGVCGGDGKSCTAECITSSISDLLGALDSNANAQEANLKQLLKRIENNARGNATLLKFVQQTRKEVEDMKIKQWQSVWTTVPVEVKNCAGVIGCAEVDRQDVLDTLKTQSLAFVTLSKKIASKLSSTLSGNKLRADDKKLLTSARRLHDQNVAISASVPRFSSICG